MAKVPTRVRKCPRVPNTDKTAPPITERCRILIMGGNQLYVEKMVLDKYNKYHPDGYRFWKGLQKQRKGEDMFLWEAIDNASHTGFFHDIPNGCHEFQVVREAHQTPRLERIC
jgi:hypothetical protein